MMNLITWKFESLNKCILSAILVAMFAGCGSETPKKEATIAPADLVAAANKVDSLFLIAFNNGDAEAITKLYWNSPELQLFPPGEKKVTGFDSVKAWYIKNFQSTKGAKLEYLSTNNVPYGDIVIAHGLFRWTMPMGDKPPMVVVSSYSEVKAWKDGTMVLVLDHSSLPIELGAADKTK